MDQNGTAWYIKIVKVIFKKDRTFCKNSYNKKKITNVFIVSGKDVKDLSCPNKQTMDEKLRVSASEKHRQLMIGPSSVGKTYYMLKMLEKHVTKDRFK